MRQMHHDTSRPLVVKALNLVEEDIYWAGGDRPGWSMDFSGMGAYKLGGSEVKRAVDMKRMVAVNLLQVMPFAGYELDWEEVKFAADVRRTWVLARHRVKTETGLLYASSDPHAGLRKWIYRVSYVDFERWSSIISLINVMF